MESSNRVTSRFMNTSEGPKKDRHEKATCDELKTEAGRNWGYVVPDLRFKSVCVPYKGGVCDR